MKNHYSDSDISSQIQSLLADEVSMADFTKMINELWYKRGDISRSLELTEAIKSEKNELPLALDNLAREIKTAAELLNETPVIPAAAHGTPYRKISDRILYCANNLPTFSSNGYATRTRGVVGGLRANGVDVTIVARPGFPWNVGYDGDRERFVVELDGSEYAHYPMAMDGLWGVSSLTETTDAFVREARLRRTSIIMAASDHLTALPALIAARILGVPFVYEVRGLWEFSRSAKVPGWENSERFALAVKLETLLVQEADLVLPITRQVSDVLVARGANPKRMMLLPNAIDPDAFLPIPEDVRYRKKIGLQADTVKVGFAGSMVPYEGLPDLVRAFDIARRRLGEPHPIELVLAGSGESEAEVSALVSELNLTDSVTLLGQIPQEEMPRLLSLVDIMVCPRISVTVTELVSPLKPLEGFSSYCAVALSDVAPNKDLAGAQQERAILFPAGDVEAIATAIVDLAINEDKRRDLCRKGRMWVLRERNWRRICKPLSQRLKVLQQDDGSNRVLSELSVGMIADQFTYESMAPEFNAVALSSTDWESQLSGLDLVIIESAWQGNGGDWHRKIGFYGDEEHGTVSNLIDECKRRGIPTAFWNKEDPVHTKRFLPTAVLCDAIFTTDANLVPMYRNASGLPSGKVLSLPFFAQPAIHNPMQTTRPDSKTFAYAGTFYGDRFPERRKKLEPLLQVANELGLTIYDRQANDPDSPYSFPDYLKSDYRGALDYSDVLAAYKTHIAHLNGNSVESSPTMFSRRVCEIAASGGIVLSTPARSIAEVFGDGLPAYHSRLEAEGLLNLWFRDSNERRLEAWLQMRSVLRGHTAADALTILARAVGIPITHDSRPEWIAVVPNATHDVIESLVAQTVLPRVVYTDSDHVDDLLNKGTHVLPMSELHIEAGSWCAILGMPVGATWFEDLLFASQFSDVDRVIPAIDDPGDSFALARAPSLASSLGEEGIMRTNEVINALDELKAMFSAGQRHISFIFAKERSDTLRFEKKKSLRLDVRESKRQNLLVAGHDLKFIRPYFPDLEEYGFDIAVDQWQDHTNHDSDESKRLLQSADVILAEWCLGNAVWYSNHVRKGQRLVTRVHLQELDRPYLAETTRGRIDAYMFVNNLYLRAAVLSHGVSSKKAHYVPNIVNDVELPRRESGTSASRRMGLVGIVPKRKRLDLALDVLERTLLSDPEAKLIVKGSLPSDYPWMKNRPEEFQYYERQFERAARINGQYPDSVAFEGHSDDIMSWYPTIDSVLSVSDFESFHYTVADGANAGCEPGLLYWPGAEYSYPLDWIEDSVEEIALRLQSAPERALSLHEWIQSTYGKRVIIPRLVDIISGDIK